MAPSPTIPTSFVPKQPVKSAARFTKSGGNVFLGLSLFILGVTVAGAIGLFAYSKILSSVERGKADALVAAQDSIDADTVETFIRSRDRFSAAENVLNGHVTLSRFFDLLESITLTNVRYSSFTYELLPDGSAAIELAGNAKSFNALAAQSNAFSSQKEIKRAIFSDIDVSETGLVNFSVTADVDPKLLAFTVGEAAPPASTPATAPAAPAATTSVPAAPGTTTPQL